jgi:hypothetical protein
MAEHHLPLASVYKGWDRYQHHLVTVIAPLSPEQLTLRAAPPLRSLGEQVAHIIAVRAMRARYRCPGASVSQPGSPPI